MLLPYIEKLDSLIAFQPRNLQIRMRPVPVAEVEIFRQPPVALHEGFINRAAQMSARQPCPGDDTQALRRIMFAEFLDRLVRRLNLRGRDAVYLLAA
jgi:hypothetical protein